MPKYTTESEIEDYTLDLLEKLGYHYLNTSDADCAGCGVTQSGDYG